LNDIHEDFDIIIANLPYVPPDYPVAEDLSYEPRIALYADHGGLALIQELLKQTPGKLLPGGAVLIECLQSQHTDVIRMAKEAGLRFSQKDGLILAFTH
jgi:release factor glutamine methyltransferase